MQTSTASRSTSVTPTYETATVPLPGGIVEDNTRSASAGILSGALGLQELELAVFDAATFRQHATLDFGSALDLPSGRLMSGNFELAGEASRCAADRAAACLTPQAAAAFGAVHVSSPFRVGDGTLLRASASFATGTASGGLAAAGGWAFVLHGEGPLAGCFSSGVFAEFAALDGGGAPRVTLAFDGCGDLWLVTRGVGTARVRHSVQPIWDPARPGLWATVRVSVAASGAVEVHAARDDDDDPRLLLAANLSLPLSTLFPADAPLWLSIAAASGCGQVHIEARAGFWLRSAWGSLERRRYSNKSTEIAVAVEGRGTVTVGFKPGVYTGAMHVRHPNGTDLIVDEAMGWTPSMDDFHFVRVTLRTGGVHTVRFVDAHGIEEHEVTVEIPDFWHSGATERDVSVRLNVYQGYVNPDGWDPLVQSIDSYWEMGGQDLAERNAVRVVADERLHRQHPEYFDLHKAKLEGILCQGVEHRIKNVEVTAEGPPDGDPAPAAPPPARVARFDAGDAGHLFALFPRAFPRKELSLDFWLKQDDSSAPHSGLFAYSVPGSSEPEVQVVDGGSVWVVKFSGVQELDVANTWKPVASLTQSLFGYRCVNAEVESDVLEEGGSFTSRVACEAVCSGSVRCAACTPYKCGRGHASGCLCSYRAMKRCVGSAPLTELNCAGHGTFKKRSAWVHAGFRWRSSDGCYTFFRNGATAAEGCGLAAGKELPEGGSVVLGAAVRDAGDTASGVDGLFSDVRLWNGFVGEDALKPALRLAPAHDSFLNLVAWWPLTNGTLDDTMGSHHFSHSTGLPVSWSVSTLPDLSDLTHDRRASAGSGGGGRAPGSTQGEPAADVAEDVHHWPASSKRVFDARRTQLAAADIDGDGTLDVVSRGADGMLRWTDGARLGSHAIGSGASCRGLQVGDADGDGDVDVFCFEVAAVQLWVNRRHQGQQVFDKELIDLNLPVLSQQGEEEEEDDEESAVDPSLSHVNGACFMDVDGDGYRDLVFSRSDESATQGDPAVRASLPTPILHLPLDGNMDDVSGSRAPWLPQADPPQFAAFPRVQGASAAQFGGAACGGSPAYRTAAEAAAETWAAWVWLAAGNGTGAAHQTVLAEEASGRSLALDGVTRRLSCRRRGERVAEGAAVPDGVWHHVACVWDVPGGAVRLFHNFREAASGPYSAAFARDAANTTLAVGCELSAAGAARHFWGHVDDVRVWDAALPFAGRPLAELSASLRLQCAGGRLADRAVLETAAPAARRVPHVKRGASGCAAALPAGRWIHAGVRPVQAYLPVGTQRATIALWVRLRAGADGGLAAAAGSGFGARLRQDARVACNFGGNATGVSIDPLPFGAWAHVACVADAEDATITVYINMVHQSTVAWYGAAAGVAPPVGSPLGLLEGDVAGEIDDVAVLLAALRPDELHAAFAGDGAQLLHAAWETTRFDRTFTQLPHLPVARGSPRTIAVWLRPKDLAAHPTPQCPVSLGALETNDPGDSACFRVCITQAGVLVIVGDRAADVSAAVEWAEGAWSHVAVTYTQAGELAVFVNGTLRGSALGLAVATEWRRGRVGGNRYGWSYEGSARDLRIYARGLLPAEVREVHAGGSFRWVRGLAAGGFGTVLRRSGARRVPMELAACVNWRGGAAGSAPADAVLTAQGDFPGGMPRLAVFSVPAEGREGWRVVAAHGSDRNGGDGETPPHSGGFDPSVFVKPVIGDLNRDSVADSAECTPDGSVTITLSGPHAGHHSRTLSACGPEGNSPVCGIRSCAASPDGLLAIVDEGTSSALVLFQSTGTQVGLRSVLATFPSARAVLATVHLPTVGTFIACDDAVHVIRDNVPRHLETEPQALLIDLPLRGDTTGQGDCGVTGEHAWEANALALTGGSVHCSEAFGSVGEAVASVWAMDTCTGAREATLFELPGLLRVALRDGQVFVRSGANGNACGAAGVRLVSPAQWHRVSVWFDPSDGVRLFVDGRFVIACRSVHFGLASDGWLVPSASLGAGFCGQLRSFTLRRGALESEASPHPFPVLSDSPAGPPVPLFAPARVICPAGSWQAEFLTKTCIRAAAAEPVAHHSAVSACASLGSPGGGCTWGSAQGAVAGSSVYHHAGPRDFGTLQACKTACCRDAVCVGAVWLASEETCALLRDFIGFTGAAAATEVVHVLHRMGLGEPPLGHFYKFDRESLQDEASTADLIPVSSTTGESLPEHTVGYQDGVSGGAVVLDANVSLAADMSGADPRVPALFWSAQVSARLLSHPADAPDDGVLRCHVTLGATFSVCQTKRGVLLSANATYSTLHPLPVDTRWHRFHLGYNGVSLECWIDCETHLTLPFDAADIGGPTSTATAWLGAGGAGTWAYDEFAVLPAFDGGGACSDAGATAGPPEGDPGRLVRLEEGAQAVWDAVQQLAGASPVWVRDGVPCGEGKARRAVFGAEAERQGHQTGDVWLAPEVLVTCASKGLPSVAVCQVPPLPGSTTTDSPSLRTTLPPDAFPPSSSTSSWRVVLSQATTDPHCKPPLHSPPSSPGCFPPGRYAAHVDETRHLYYDTNLPWTEFRSATGHIEFKIAWPGGACDGSSLPPIVWRQRSLPTAFGAVDGFEPVSVPYGGFAGLRAADGGSGFLWSAGAGFGLGAAGAGCPPLAGPDGAPPAAVEVSVNTSPLTRAADQRRGGPPSGLSVSFWIHTRAEPDGGVGVLAGSTDAQCPGARCGCPVPVAAVARGLPADAVSAAFAAGAVRSTFSAAPGAGHGLAFHCAKHAPSDGRSQAAAGNGSWLRAVEPATRRYTILTYGAAGAAAPGVSIACEGAGALRGSCAVSVGGGGVNAPQHVRNAWAESRWVHFALAFDAAAGCVELYADGALAHAGCGHAVAPAAGGGVLAIGGGAGVAGALADLRLWSRGLSIADVRAAYSGADDARLAAGLVGRWPLRSGDVGFDALGRSRLAQDGVFTHGDVPGPGSVPEGAEPPLRLRDFVVGTRASPFTGGAGGATVALWHRSARRRRVVFSYSAAEAAAPAFSVRCASGACRIVSFGEAAGVSFPDVLRDSRWRHLSMSFDSAGGPVDVFVDGVRVPTAPFRAEAVPGAAVADGVFSSGNDTRDAAAGGACRAAAGNATEAVEVRYAERHRVAAVTLCYAAAVQSADAAAAVLQVDIAGDEPADWQPCATGVARDVLAASGGCQRVQCEGENAVASRVRVTGAYLALCEVQLESAGVVRAWPEAGVFALGGVPCTRGVCGAAGGAGGFDGSFSDVRVHTQRGAAGAPSPWASWKLAASADDASGNGRDLRVLPNGGLRGVQGEWRPVPEGPHPIDAFLLKDGRVGVRLGDQRAWKQRAGSGCAVEPVSPVETCSEPSTLDTAPGGIRFSSLASGNGSGCGGGGGSTAVKDVAAPVYAWADDQFGRCGDLWTSAQDVACSAARTVRRPSSSVPQCRSLCRNTPGCTGFSYPCADGTPDCCDVHDPFQATRLVAEFSLADEFQATITSLDAATQRTVSGSILWDGAVLTAVDPVEFAGASHVIPPDRVPTNASIRVQLSEPAVLYAFVDDRGAGGFAADGWQDVTDGELAVVEGPPEVFLFKKAVSGGAHYVPPRGSSAEGWAAVSVRPADAGAGDDGTCGRSPQQGFTHHAVTRECADGRRAGGGLALVAGGRQCVAGPEGVLDVVEWARSVPVCASECADAAGCSHFTFFRRDGGCVLHEGCGALRRCPAGRPCASYAIGTRPPATPRLLQFRGLPPAVPPPAAGGPTAGRFPLAVVEGFPAAGFTLEFWMRADDVGRAACAVSYGTAAGFSLVVGAGTVAAVTIAGAEAAYPVPLVSFSARRWTHVAVSWSEATAACVVTIDGVAQPSFTVTPSATIESRGVLRIGQYFEEGLPVASKLERCRA
ncbi:hypothetical protein DIPPA_27874 [Diplonema papillatum]|nr:hypothetical protein DIPPA_27874 [Diplonema papillatum]